MDLATSARDKSSALLKTNAVRRFTWIEELLLSEAEGLAALGGGEASDMDGRYVCRDSATEMRVTRMPGSRTRARPPAGNKKASPVRAHSRAAATTRTILILLNGRGKGVATGCVQLSAILISQAVGVATV